LRSAGILPAVARASRPRCMWGQPPSAVRCAKRGYLQKAKTRLQPRPVLSSP